MNNSEIISKLMECNHRYPFDFESFLEKTICVDVRKLCDFEDNPYFDDRDSILNMVNFLNRLKYTKPVSDFYVVKKTDEEYIKNIISKFNKVQSAIYHAKDCLDDFKPNSVYILEISIGEAMFLCRVLDYCVKEYYEIIYNLTGVFFTDVYSFNVDVLNNWLCFKIMWK